MANIVIVGGGFGGVYTAKHILKQLDHSKHQVTLINKTNYFLFTPMLHEIATGGISLQHVAEPIRKIIRNKNFEFIEDEVTKVDFNKKTVSLKDAESVKYDYLVMASGAGTNFFNIPGAQEHTYTLKNLKEAFEIRNKIIESIEKAQRTKDIDHHLTYAIIGAGPTGVEIAGEIIEFAKQIKEDCHNLTNKKITVYLVQRGPKILPMLHDACVKNVTKELERKGITVLTNSAVTKIFKDGFEVNGKKKYHTGMVIWASGVKSNEVKTIPKMTNERGSFEVEPTLKIKGRTKEFALGDCALCVDTKGERVPWLAQSATRQAKVLAHNISAQINGGKEQQFTFKPDGLLVSVGQKYAIADVKGLRFSGFFAWWVWRTIYLGKLVGTANKIRVAYEWTMDLFFKRDSTKI